MGWLLAFYCCSFGDRRKSHEIDTLFRVHVGIGYRSLTLAAGLIEVERALGWSAGFVFFGLLQEFFEFLFPHFAGAQMRRKAFFEDVVPARFRAFELLHGGVEILDGGLLLHSLVPQHNLQFGIDLQSGFATRAFYFKGKTVRLRHT